MYHPQYDLKHYMQWYDENWTCTNEQLHTFEVIPPFFVRVSFHLLVSYVPPDGCVGT